MSDRRDVQRNLAPEIELELVHRELLMPGHTVPETWLQRDVHGEWKPFCNVKYIGYHRANAKWHFKLQRCAGEHQRKGPCSTYDDTFQGSVQTLLNTRIQDKFNINTQSSGMWFDPEQQRLRVGHCTHANCTAKDLDLEEFAPHSHKELFLATLELHNMQLDEEHYESLYDYLDEKRTRQCAKFRARNLKLRRDE